MTDRFIDAAEVQALINHHAKSISEAIEDTGITPKQQPILVATAERLLELSNRLGEFSVVES